MCDKEQRKVFSKEVPALLRNQKNYKEQLDIVEESSEVDLQKTKGVKRYCELIYHTSTYLKIRLLKHT